MSGDAVSGDALSRARSYDPPRHVLSGLGHRSLIVGVVGMGASLLGILVDSDQFFRSYLVGWLTWVSIALGCLAILLIDHLAGGRWGVMIRRTTEAASSTMPALGLMMIPIFLGLPSLYQWAQPEVVAADTLLRSRPPSCWPKTCTRSSARFALEVGE